VKGTWASELRTRFCPMRFTYSVIPDPEPVWKSLPLLGILACPCGSRFRASTSRPTRGRPLAIADGVHVALAAVVLDATVVGLLDNRREDFLVLVLRTRVGSGLSLSSLTVESWAPSRSDLAAAGENVEGASNNVDTATVPTNSETS